MVGQAKTNLIPDGNFPKENIPFELKKTKEIGLNVAHAIQNEWFTKSTDGCLFYQNKEVFRRRRLYGQGMQSTRGYKDFMSVNGDMSYMNLNFAVVPIIPKFIDIIVNGMVDRKYEIVAYSSDPISTKNKVNYRKGIERDMAAKDFLMKAKNELNINVFNSNPDTLPENQEELEIRLDMDYKPSIEISEQLAITSVMKNSDFENVTNPRILRDLVECGIGIAKNTFNPTESVKVNYVDPENFIYSFTEDPFFRDCNYFGEVQIVNVSEVFRKKPNLSDDEKQEIVDAEFNWNSYFGLTSDRGAEQRGKVAILNFNYKTTREHVYKIKTTATGGKKAIKRDESFKVDSEDADFKKESFTDEVWFEGELILGTNILLKWELAKNMVRPKSNEKIALPMYSICAPHIYKGKVNSLVERMIPFADDINILNLKIQQTIQRIMPDGHFIDIDGLAEIDLGNGNAYNPTEAFNMLMQTGSVFGRSSTVGGEFNNGKMPITEITTSGANNKLAALERQYSFKLQMIRDVTGVNEARDGSTPDKNSLVGLQKMAAYSSNVATRHILNADLYIIRDLSKSTSYRIADILNNEYLKEDFIQKIGETSVNDLEYMKNRHLLDFDIFIELVPDEEQKLKLEADISLEIQAGNLGVEDKYAIINIRNTALAYKYLKVIKEKRMKKNQENKMKEIEAQTQGNIQSAQAASQEKLTLIDAEKQSKLEVQNQFLQGEIAKLQEQARLKKDLMKDEFNYQMGIAVAESDNAKNRETYKEDRKDERTDKQATQQSKLIDQRNKNGKPVDFESKYDNLEQFEI
jgi:hypothetical protein